MYFEVLKYWFALWENKVNLLIRTQIFHKTKEPCARVKRKFCTSDNLGQPRALEFSP